jgi:hypothetical protein
MTDDARGPTRIEADATLSKLRERLKEAT